MAYEWILSACTKLPVLQNFDKIIILNLSLGMLSWITKAKLLTLPKINPRNFDLIKHSVARRRSEIDCETELLEIDLKPSPDRWYVFNHVGVRHQTDDANVVMVELFSGHSIFDSHAIRRNCTTTTTTISFICMTITKYYSIAKATWN